jgi:hypothetical protein
MDELQKANELIAKNERRLAVMKVNSKKHYEANKTKRLEQIKAYKQANSEKYKEYQKEYMKEYHKKQKAKLQEALKVVEANIL